MSIDQIRKATENKGCQVLMWITGAALAIGMIATSFSFLGNKDQKNQNTTPTVMSVEGKEYSAEDLNNLARAIEMQNQMQMLVSDDPQFKLSSLQQAVTNIISEAAITKVASQEGLTVSAEDVEKFANESFEEALLSLKSQLVAENKITADATDEEFEKVLKETQAIQTTLADTRQQKIKNMKDAYENEESKAQVVNGVLVKKLIDKYESGVKVTEEQVKADFDKFTFDQLRFDNVEFEASKRQEMAEAALAELQSGKSIEEVRKSALNATEPDEVSYSRAMLEQTTQYEPMLALKEGETSSVLLIGGVPTIFKLKSIKPDLPETWETDKDQVIQMKQQNVAMTTLTETMDSTREGLAVEWKDDIVKEIYLYGQDMQNPDLAVSEETLTNALKDRLENVENALITNSSFPQYGTVLKYVILNQLANSTNPDVANEYKPLALDQAVAVSSEFGSLQFSMYLAQQLFDAGDSERGFEQLLAAAQSNIDVSMLGEQYDMEVGRIAKEQYDNKAISADQLSEITAERERWKAEFEQAKKDEAELEAERKKLEEELDKENIDPDNEAPDSNTETPAESENAEAATTGN